MGVARLGLKAEHQLRYARLERKEAQLLGFALRAPTKFGYGPSAQQNVGALPARYKRMPCKRRSCASVTSRARAGESPVA